MGAVKPARPQRVVLRHVKSGPFGKCSLGCSREKYKNNFVDI